ncbi:hypothetical protein [Alteromonas lipolytica]|uniref:PEP-CTERM protein-sorting domain-containing protein n=1 Tax=Alteromonas lipolytica TaxID=1856405 RepID=A0A1E8FGM5_9ALTE|nr:hypothetical protein [Alteromonas lipolytica]OFI35095.1 hypothetical protein BFC17_16235 [Alteromonas lipolytica]GGF56599.1 hypothetical protein GCM10011338_06140 [Alteromonas lipolytica]
MKRLAISLFFTLFISQTANASVIALFGDRGEKNTVANKLMSLGHTVTTFGTNINGDLSVYDSVWGISAFDPLSTSEQTVLSNYLASGGGLYLTGERPCCETLNSSLTSFVNGVLDAPTVQIGGLGDAGSVGYINPTVVGNLANLPNTVTTWSPNASGGISGVLANNVFASTATNVTNAAAWDMDDLVGDAGRLVVMMDVNWHTNGQLDLLENIEVFLSSASILQQTPTPQVNVSAPTNSVYMLLGLAGIVMMRRKKRA